MGQPPRYHPPMEVVTVADAATFLTRGAPVMGHDPAANNLPLGIAQQLVDQPRHVRFRPLLDRRARRRGRGRRDAHSPLPGDPGRSDRRRRRRGRRLRGRAGAGRAVVARCDGQRAVGEPVRRGMDRRHRPPVAAGRRPGRLRARRGANPAARVGVGTGRDDRRPRTVTGVDGRVRSRSPAGDASRRGRHGARHRRPDRGGRDRRVHALGDRRAAGVAHRMDADRRRAPASVPSTPRPRNGVAGTHRTWSPT